MCVRRNPLRRRRPLRIRTVLPLRGVPCSHRLRVQRGRRHRANQTGRSQRRGPHPAVRAARRRTRQLLRQLRFDRVFVRAPRRVRARAARNACSRRLRCGRRFTSASRKRRRGTTSPTRCRNTPGNHPRACSVGPRTHSHRLCCRRKAAGPNTRGVCSACSTTSINTWTKLLDLEAVADVAHFSPFHFHRIFAAWMGETPADYLRGRRLDRAAEQLAEDRTRIGTRRRSFGWLRFRRIVGARVQDAVRVHAERLASRVAFSACQAHQERATQRTAAAGQIRTGRSQARSGAGSRTRAA